MRIFKNKKLIKSSLIFTLTILPFSLAGIYLAVSETIKLIPEEQKKTLIEQFGDESAIIGLSLIQPILLTIICSFSGFIISSKIGLMKPVKLEQKPILITFILGSIGALMLVGDVFTFGKLIPQVALYYETPITATTILYSALYGGIVEEILLRLFFMSLLALIIKSILFKKDDKYSIKIYVTANIISAFVFAAGHLPATYQLFGELTPLILLRCFLLNGIVGIFFGYLYRKYGIQYAMTAHALCHIISKVILSVIL